MNHTGECDHDNNRRYTIMYALQTSLNFLEFNVDVFKGNEYPLGDDIVVYMIYNYTHVHTAVYYDTLCMHLLIIIGAIQAIGLVVMETAVAPLKIKVDILEVETTEVNISV